MFYATLGRAHAALALRAGEIRGRGEGQGARRGERGQGTVEYVGLILLVSLLMVGMVAAMKGFQGKQGVELAGVIVEKIKDAVDRVSFK